MAHKLTVLLDGDDTLWRTQEIYDGIKENFAGLLYDTGIKEINLISRLDELDAQRVAIKGFTSDRFIESMLIIYAQFSKLYSLEWNVQVEKKIIGFDETLKYMPPLYEDTIQALENLKKHARLFLFSIGDQETQLSKIKKLGLAHFFEKTHIVKTKNKDVLEIFITKLGVNTKHVWMVGNSIRSDVVPALSIGLNSILVDRGNWKYDQCVLPEQGKLNYIRVKTLKDAADKILVDM